MNDDVDDDVEDDAGDLGSYDVGVGNIEDGVGHDVCDLREGVDDFGYDYVDGNGDHAGNQSDLGDDHVRDDDVDALGGGHVETIM